jgi:hypothetical protein
MGGVAISAWGGPKRRVHGVLLGWMLSCLLGQVLLGYGRGLPLWIPAVFLGSLFNPLINSSNQAIWQAKVAPDVQGRVFTARALIAWITQPISPLIAGPLAAGTFGGLVGTGPGAGMALWLMLTGILGALVGLGGYAFPVVRNAEDILPDHQAAPAGE